MRIKDIVKGAEHAQYHLTLGNGFILFSRFGNYAAINSASSRKDEKRMLKKMGVE